MAPSEISDTQSGDIVKWISSKETVPSIPLRKCNPLVPGGRQRKVDVAEFREIDRRYGHDHHSVFIMNFAPFKVGNVWQDNCLGHHGKDFGRVRATRYLTSTKFDQAGRSGKDNECVGGVYIS